MGSDPQVKQQQRGDVEVTIGGTKFVLEPTLKNIDAVEGVLKKTFTQMLDELQNKQLHLTTNEFAMFIFVTQKDPKVPFTKIRNLIHLHGSAMVVPGVAAFMSVAISGALEDVDESPESGNPEAKTS